MQAGAARVFSRSSYKLQDMFRRNPKPVRISEAEALGQAFTATESLAMYSLKLARGCNRLQVLQARVPASDIPVKCPSVSELGLGPQAMERSGVLLVTLSSM